jgi:signal transduction histidine kinase
MISYRLLKALTVLIPTLIIGGFEFIRHEYMMHVISMEAGNWVIILLTLVISYMFSIWMFGIIERKNKQITEEKARRAVYEERERIAQELHDNIAQILFFLNVKMNQGKLDEARAAVSEIDQNLRQAIFNLRSAPEEGVSLIHRLGIWLDEWHGITGIAVSKNIQLPDTYFTTAEEIQLFAIIQEAFMNIRKHSCAMQASILLRATAKEWTLVINDDGKGLNDSVENAKKYGLSMMKKRARELKATFNIEARHSGGTELRVRSGRSE